MKKLAAVPVVLALVSLLWSCTSGESWWVNGATGERWPYAGPYFYLDCDPWNYEGSWIVAIAGVYYNDIFGRAFYILPWPDWEEVGITEPLTCCFEAIEQPKDCYGTCVEVPLKQMSIDVEFTCY